jgi:hypothetical protein
MKIDDIVLRGVLLDAAGERGSALEIAKTCGPARSGENVVEEPRVNLMAESPELVGVLQGDTRSASFANAPNPSGDEESQEACTLWWCRNRSDEADGLRRE